MLNMAFMSVKYNLNLKECECVSRKASYFCVAFIFPTYQLSRILRGMYLTWRGSPVVSLLVNVKVAQLCSAVCGPMDCTVHGIKSPGQNTGAGKPFPSPGDLLNPRIEPRSSVLILYQLSYQRGAVNKCQDPLCMSGRCVLWR